MDEMITTIYEITVNMDNTLKDGDYHEFERQLNKRSDLMIKVDEWKLNQPSFQYSEKAKRLFEKILLIEQRLTSLLKEEITGTQISLNQIEKKKQLSKRYLPYIKQTSGVFLDAKK